MFGSDHPCDVEILNQAFVDAPQYINPVIADKSKKLNSLFRNMIERGVFTYGEGYVKKAETFYGGMPLQDCSASWSVVEPSRPAGTRGENDPGHDSCRYESPVIGYGIEEKQYTLYQATRRTLDICLNDIVFKWQFEKQLALTFNMLSSVTLGEWEMIEKDFYVNFANKYMVVEDPTVPLGLAQFTMTMGSCMIDLPQGGFIQNVGMLTQEVLDRFYSYLYRQAPDAAVGTKNGMPQFALITSPETSTDIIRKNMERRRDMRYADPGFLIDGYGTVEAYQGYALVHDPETLRFKISADLLHLERVYPYVSSPTTIGDAINANPEYIMAPFEASIIFLKDVYRALVPPSNPSRISGFEFNPADNLGEFHWINIQDRCENILREKGFFFGRFRIAPEPWVHSNDAILILHRRCNQLDLAYCEDYWSCTDMDVVACAQHDPEEDADEATVYDITVEEVLGCGPGQLVLVTFNDNSTAYGMIVDDSGAPTYTIGFLVPFAGGYCGRGGGNIKTVECVYCVDPDYNWPLLYNKTPAGTFKATKSAKGKLEAPKDVKKGKDPDPKDPKAEAAKDAKDPKAAKKE